MECYPLSRGDKIPRIYDFGFDGKCFQIILEEKYWIRFVEIAGKGTYFAQAQGSLFVTPASDKDFFGFQGFGKVTRLLTGNVCVEIPSFSLATGDDHAREICSYAETMRVVLIILRCILSEVNEKKIDHGNDLQLFVLETYLGNYGDFHAAGLEITFSPSARVFLEKMGNNIRLDKAVQGMVDHHYKSYPEESSSGSYLRHSFDARIRTNGVLHINTLGNCACLGTMPRDFDQTEGYRLASHNVDTIYQQFSLLVAIASVWQMLRDGLKNNQ
jgi:hypothetical protein